jgi:hypothetical protein
MKKPKPARALMHWIEGRYYAKHWRTPKKKVQALLLPSWIA